MADWRALEPLSAAGLLHMAQMAARETRTLVDRNARLSHVGFRSNSRLEWEMLKDAMAEAGELFPTFKPDGREIPFVKLARPLVAGSDVLYYIELPAPKGEQVEEPRILVAYHISGENRAPVERGGYEVREQSMHAEDFIARDKGRTF